ncbi:MAG TPA: hypothetical protein VKR06_39050 [Ktedonosporobacter sp.]|nr:hypothetical protein [Ktedonosporobacter sp.]
MTRKRLGMFVPLILCAGFLMCGVVAFPASVPAQALSHSQSVPIGGHSLFLTAAQGAALEMHPGMRGKNGEIPIIKALPKGSILLKSASRCNQSVCFSITRRKLSVSDWLTISSADVATCTYAVFWANGLAATSNEICGPAGAIYVSDWPNPGSFPTQTKVCNSWATIGGFACETIHT